MSGTKVDRALGCIIGTLVSDAAAMPLHWIYNYEKIDAVIKGLESCAFLTTSHSPFYDIPTGNNSCYCDEGFALLKSIHEAKGFDVDVYKSTLESTFGENSKYKYGTVRKRPYPINFAWCNGSILHFLEMYKLGELKTGDDDSQGDAFSKIAPIVVLFAGKPELKQIVETLTRVTQDDELAVNYAIAGALILENYILNGPNDDNWETIFSQLDEEVVKNIKKVQSMKDINHRDAVSQFGWQCYLPGSFMGSLHGILSRKNLNFKELVERNIHAAGDCCSRGCFIGSCAGAIFGLSGVPQDWINKTFNASEALTMAKSIIHLNENIS